MLPAIVMVCCLAGMLFLWNHINKQKRKAEEAYAQVAALAKIYESMFLVDLDTDEILPVKANDYLLSLMASCPGGFSAKVKMFNSKLLAPEFLAAMDAFTDIHTLRERMNGRETITFEFNGLRTGWNRARFVAVGDVAASHTVIYAVENINSDKTRTLQLQAMAERDLMTGVLNRGNGEMQIRGLLADGRGGMLAIIDMDEFKQINDTYGHLAGDEVLRGVADSLKGAFRESDVVLRYGGDEFMVFAPCMHSVNQAEDAMKRFFKRLSNLQLHKVSAERVQASVGICLIPEEDNKGLDEYISLIDKGVYQAKKEKGNAVIFAEDK